MDLKPEIAERLSRIANGKDTKLKKGTCCCECGVEMAGVLGDGAPSPGAAALCSECGCMSIFSADLDFRHPTDEEIFEAAKDPTIQAARRLILEFIKQRKEHVADAAQ
jgi:hypothetical protein